MKTITSIKQHKGQTPLTVITAYDALFASLFDQKVDIILVGDSLAMVAMGMEDTSEVLVEEMLLHCRSVARAAKTAFTVRTSWKISDSGTDAFLR